MWDTGRSSRPPSRTRAWCRPGCNSMVCSMASTPCSAEWGGKVAIYSFQSHDCWELWRAKQRSKMVARNCLRTNNRIVIYFTCQQLIKRDIGISWKCWALVAPIKHQMWYILAIKEVLPETEILQSFHLPGWELITLHRCQNKGILKRRYLPHFLIQVSNWCFSLGGYW